MRCYRDRSPKSRRTRSRPGRSFTTVFKVVLRQLQEEGRGSGENLARERTAFLSAVGKIEFGQRAEVRAAGQAPQEEAPQSKRRPKHSVLGRIAMRMAGACVLLVAISFAYLVIFVRLDAASAERWVRETAPKFELWEELVKMPGTVVNTNTLVRATEFNALRAVFADGQPRTIEAIAKQFAEPVRPLVVRALHWLVKIGLLQMVAGGGRGPQ